MHDQTARKPITITAPGATIRVETGKTKTRDADRLLRVAIAALLRSDRSDKPAA